jgi:NADP-dependent 3-hydroxy acid dehydrogenase YdfG
MMPQHAPHSCGMYRGGYRARIRSDRWRHRVGTTVFPGAVLHARHVAEAVLTMARLPLEANVQFLTITATAMPFVGRG